MSFKGYIDLEDTLYFLFTTRRFSTGATYTLGGTPAVSVYEENNTTQITAGVSLTADYDSVTGLNQVTVVATAANGYEAGKHYDVVITTGTVDSVSVVGEVVGHFIMGPASANTTQFAGTAITAAAGIPEVKVASIAANAITATAIANDAITAVKIADNAITANKIATSAIDEIADGVWDEATAGHVTAGSTAVALTDILTDTGTTLDGRIPAALVSGRMDASVGAVAAGAITAAGFGAAAITSTVLAGDCITQAQLSAGAISEIQAGLATSASITSIDGKIDTIDTVVDEILVDTGTTLDAAIADLPTNAELATSQAAADDATLAAIAALNNLSAAQVNAEVVDALATDTYAEPGQGAPAATAALSAKIGYLYKFARNKVEQTATEMKVYDDAGTTVDQKSTVSDDGTTYTRGEIVTGP